MLSGFSITSMTATSDSNQVSDSTLVSLTLKMPVPFKTSDLLYVTVPVEIDAPL